MMTDREQLVEAVAPIAGSRPLSPGGPRALPLQPARLDTHGFQLDRYPALLSDDYQAIQQEAFAKFKPGVNASNKLARGTAWGVLVNGQISWQDRTGYSLSADLNPEEGGRTRIFTPIDRALLEHPATVAMFHDIFAHWGFPESSYEVPYQVQLSGIRYEPTLAVPAMPSPVIPHQDSVDGVIVVLHKTPNLVGGLSRIYDLDGAPQWQVDLNAGDALFVRDAAVLHQVTPILLEPGSRWAPGDQAYRDVLLVRFQRVGR
jgi:hypothetical protein